MQVCGRVYYLLFFIFFFSKNSINRFLSFLFRFDLSLGYWNANHSNHSFPFFLKFGVFGLSFFKDLVLGKCQWGGFFILFFLSRNGINHSFFFLGIRFA
jgi:hypothetical protein